MNLPQEEEPTDMDRLLNGGCPEEVSGFVHSNEVWCRHDTLIPNFACGCPLSYTQWIIESSPVSSSNAN
ncbi:unnamed protein product [Caenorhabditis sp. 36 PRJEB53466]|nr:unnamed protein product [Caenorhabditis sp. 36 PRJEB53466]